MQVTTLAVLMDPLPSFKPSVCGPLRLHLPLLQLRLPLPVYCLPPAVTLSTSLSTSLSPSREEISLPLLQIVLVRMEAATAGRRVGSGVRPSDFFGWVK